MRPRDAVELIATAVVTSVLVWALFTIASTALEG